RPASPPPTTPAPPPTPPLPLHDALPISDANALERLGAAQRIADRHLLRRRHDQRAVEPYDLREGQLRVAGPRRQVDEKIIQLARSEEHTSELQSRSDLVCRLLLETKNIC